MTDRDCLPAEPWVRPVAASHVSGTRWRRRATKMMVTGLVLAGMAAGCSGPPAVTASSVTSCFQFAARAIQRHVTVTASPAACRGLSQVEVNLITWLVTAGLGVSMMARWITR
jgi:hypothetical protein